MRQSFRNLQRKKGYILGGLRTTQVRHKGPLPEATPTKSNQIRPNPTKSDQIRRSDSVGVASGRGPFRKGFFFRFFDIAYDITYVPVLFIHFMTNIKRKYRPLNIPCNLEVAVKGSQYKRPV